MKVIDILKRSGRNLKQAKARTLLTAMAIGVGAFALTLTLAASNGAQNFVNNVISDNFDPAELIVANDETLIGKGDDTIPKVYDENYGTGVSNSGAPIQVKQLSEKDITKISKYKNVEQVREEVALNIQYITRDGKKKYIANAAILNPAQNPEVLAGSISKPLADDEVLLPEAYVSALGFKNNKDAIGKTLTMAVRKSVDLEALAKTGATQGLAAANKAAQQNSETREFKIGAVLKKPLTAQPGTEIYLFISSKPAKELYDIINENTPQYRKYGYAYVRVKDGANKPENITAVQKQLSKDGYVSQSVEETQAFLTSIIDFLRGIVAAFGLIAVIASVFGIVNTMYISVLQRTREIGLMKALGMRRRDIGRLFRFEAAWIGFLGGLLGSMLAIGLGVLINPAISKKLELGNEHLLIFEPKQIIGLIIILIVVGTFAGLLPARKASKLDPIEALRTE